MGGVQTQRHTKGKRNRRRSHLALSRTYLAVCAKCNRAVLPHRICEYCGFYNGKEVIDVMAKLTKKEKKKREREEAAAHEAHSHGPAARGEATPELNPEELSKK
ncbi:50S ribosomal protein L32 [Candidatus Azambacteria bacterium]|nr:50S ribosomal protein L32 [Candidatus Azambacteria bacterium]